MRRSWTAWLAVAGCGLILATAAKAADLTEIQGRLHGADALSSLDSADVKPWHLTMTVKLFDDKGKPTDEGSVEEWWSGPGTERREYKTTAYTATEILQDGKLYRTKGVGSPPYYLELLRMQAVHPMPSSSDIDASAPELRKQSFSNVPLGCIMLSMRAKLDAPAPLGLFPTYCLDPGKASLRIGFEFGGQVIVRNGIVSFQGKEVAATVAIVSNSVSVANSKVASLQEEAIPESKLPPSDDLTQQPRGVRVASGTMASLILSKPDPIYPPAARVRQVTGTVVLRAVIGTDGLIHLLRVMSGPDPDLDMAALAAARKWTYRPYLLDGAPTDVDTTITINFTIGH